MSTELVHMHACGHYYSYTAVTDAHIIYACGNSTMFPLTNFIYL